jgi:ribosomal protein S8E
MGQAWNDSHPRRHRAAQQKHRRCRRQAKLDALPQDVTLALEAAADAQAFRRQIRRKATPGGERNERILVVLDRLADAARPLRSAMGMVAYGYIEDEQLERDLTKASRTLQAERKALRRMLR